MASELIVQTLKGPTSGANANKVIIPSGQTLEVSGSVTGITQGITMVDQWRLNADEAGSTGSVYLIQNWERIDTDSPGYFGTGMSVSSGIFTFPSTGYYSVDFRPVVQYSGTLGDASCSIQLSQDGGSNWQTVTSHTFSIASSSATYNASSSITVIDVTDASQFKVRFSRNGANSSFVYKGDNYYTRTSSLFMRLGDT
jgi:hypothetical protein